MNKKIIKSLLIAGTFAGTIATTTGVTSVSAGAVNPGGSLCELDPDMDLRSYKLEGTTSYTYSTADNKSVSDIVSAVKAGLELNEYKQYCKTSSGNPTTALVGSVSTTISVDATGLIPSTAGTYTVTAKATYNDTEYTKQVTITIEEEDTKAPVISGSKAAYYVSIDNPTPIESILAGITAEDETDGVVATYIKSDNYSANKNTLGEYEVVVGAKDKSNNEATITIIVKVVDVTLPTITGTSSYVSNMSSPITVEQIKSNLTASDNVDNELELIKVNDTFTGNEQKVGTYQVSYYTQDKSGNQSETFVVKIEVKDDIAPVITASTTELEISPQGKFTDEYFLSLLTASDNVDGNITDKIIMVDDTYSSNTMVVGDYYRSYKVEDTAGNSSEIIVIRVKVVDVTAPVFYLSDAFIGTEVVLTPQQIAEIIAKLNGINTVNYTIDCDEYIASAEIPGTYAVAVSYSTDAGEEIGTYTANIRVFEAGTAIIDQSKEEAKHKTENWFKSVWNKIKSTTKTVFVKIGNFVKKIFNFIVDYIFLRKIWGK